MRPFRVAQLYLSVRDYFHGFASFCFIPSAKPV